MNYTMVYLGVALTQIAHLLLNRKVYTTNICTYP